MTQIGRADLLLALHLGAGDTLALEHDDRHWWGYRRQPRAEPEPLPTFEAPPVAPAAAVPLPAPEPPATEDPLKLPLQMPVAWVLREQTSRDLPQELQGLPALTEDDLRALAPEPLPYRDLVPWARALPGLRRHTDRQVPGEVDWPHLAAALARGELPPRLPCRTRQRWPQQLLLVLDFSPRLDPYRWDMHRLAEQLDAQMPGASLSVRLLCLGPAGPWQAWRHPRKAALASGHQPWEVHLAPGTVVVFATDLGLFDPQPALHAAWLNWAAELRGQGCRLIALAPLSPQQATPQALQRFELLRWSPDSRWRRERRAASHAGAAEPGGDAALNELVALAATAVRIDPPLLRAWRSLLPAGAGGDAGLEGRLWNHPHLQSAGLTCATRPEHLDADLERHGALPAALRQSAHDVQSAQHAHLRRSLGCAEATRWSAAVGGNPGLRLTGQPEEALSFEKRLLRSLIDAPIPVQSAHIRHLLGAAELVLAAASPKMRALDAAVFSALEAATARWRSTARRSTASAASPGAATGLWMVVQQGWLLKLMPADSADALGPGQVLGKPVHVPASVQGLVLTSFSGSRWLPLKADGLELAALVDDTSPLTATLERHTWVIERAARPAWASAWKQAGGAPSAAVPLPVAGADGQASLVWFTPPLAPQRVFGLGGERVDVGLDAYGAYAEVNLRYPGKILRPTPAPALRLRWIPPGQFRMGSPEGQGDADEHPQHPVAISQGFWLAEGPCTQALWQAVMGSNPSHFKNHPDALQRPVEQVSFDGVQQFLQRLYAWLPPDCEAFLPTEAQWEYAARAGTETAYPWGDVPDDSRANWNMQYKGTTPVGRFAPNPWGLLDMHGNVWEWCADDRRTYTAEAVRDPDGELEGPRGRAVRGGAWRYHPGIARSACRNGWHPGYRFLNLGFRLALRSSSPGAGGPPAAPAPGPGGDSLWERAAAAVRDALKAGSPGKAPPPRNKRRG